MKSKVETHSYICFIMSDTKKMFIGGNWKCNGTRDKVASLVTLLNGGGEFPSNAEVVVAPPALHVGSVQGTLRKDIHVAVQVGSLLDICFLISYVVRMYGWSQQQERGQEN